jgi:hypothetical protein
MGKVFACFSIALHNFKKWAVNPRLYILLLMEVLYLHSRLSPVGELCARTGYKVTPYLLPFLLDEGSAGDDAVPRRGAVVLRCAVY